MGRIFAVVLAGSLLLFTHQAHAQCTRTVKADVVAIDQAYQVNRLGTSRPGGLLFALRGDVESTDPGNPALQPGRVQLRSYKRPRPIVLRANVGDCLDIRFQNLLAKAPTDPVQPVTRNVSLHVAGMSVRNSIASDGTWAGQNPLGATGMSGDVAPGASTVYQLFANAEGAFLLYSTPGDYNNFGTMQLTMGLFGALIVEPAGAEWYRSQVTEAELALATTGTFPSGHPKLNYDAVYPAGHPRAGKPILRMLDGQQNIVHSDLTAVITGPERGLFPGGPGENPVLPDRNWPFREVTIHYHESQDLVQPFPYSYPQGAGSRLSFVPTINAGSDSFAINYGVAGIGAEVLSNRIGVGPSTDCVECKFEEFFLSSWPLGDPGLVVDVPANAEQSTPCLLDAIFLGAPARGHASRPCVESQKRPTKAFYADDPSNVYHTYLGDHVRFRILHAGAAVTHVHHHHAHQWLHSWMDQDSNYLDAQSIGPGSSFTLDLVYDGSGNRNLTAGDSIFHCHFYPHFASGMWALFRVHDAFEAGTPLDEAQRPARGRRALPDPQIVTGTPIPAIVPLPTMPMAPMPSPVEIVDGQVRLAGDGFPGFPFYIPGISGHRAPHPPLDFAVDPKTNETYDGGLPRHLVTAGVVSNEQHSTTDWSKDLAVMTAFQLPEEGTPIEKRAMRFFGQHLHPSITQQGVQAAFRVNGLPRGPQRGAPFADPAVVDGRAVGTEVPAYRGVNLQLDTVFNKAGWHYPQQRMMALWQDVQSLVAGERPPQPLFFRAASNDVIEYWHTNLVPAYYELDDFQVRTPTDILGQHIHLVKFDVTSSDGAGNGFNYEDGTYSPEEVRGRIEAINAAGGLWNYARTAQTKLAPKAIAELGDGPGATWVGAQATVQRWWVDPLMDSRGNDRTYMTVFTHDHFGPSTHQMAGLYGGLLVEPRGTSWWSLDGQSRYRDWTQRNDGGPTGFTANILYDDPAKAADNYREFALAWADTQLVYNANSRSQPDCYTYLFGGKRISQTSNCVPLADGAAYQGWSETTANASAIINCAQCTPASFPPASAPPSTAASTPGSPSPNLIADFGFGMMSMNYRGEPIPLRVSPPLASGPTVLATDLALAFASITRPNPAFNSQPAGGSRLDPTCTTACFTFPLQPVSQGMQPTDPFTPLLAGYEGDKVQFRLLVGAHTSMHDFTLNGLRWKYAPFSPDSGYRSTQFMILSEHFEPLLELPRIGASLSADYLYNPTASYEGLVNGLWGLLRSFNPSARQSFLAPLRPTTPAAPPRPQPVANTNCELPEPCVRHFDVRVKAVPGKGLIYNARGVNLGNGSFDSAHPLHDPSGLVYVRGDQPVDGATVQPLVLRARAGDWIHVTLHNDLTGAEPVFEAANAESAGRFSQIPYAFPYQNVLLSPSPNVGLHAQLVDYDVTHSDGMTVGNNPIQTAAPGAKRHYWWYAGRIEDGKAIPVEYGAVNLLPADPLMHIYHGLFGALVIEPQGSRWVEDPQSPVAATVFTKEGVYREFVLMAQNDVSMKLNGSPLYAAGAPMSAVNYKSEPPFYRYGALWNPAIGVTAPQDWTDLSFGDLQTIFGVTLPVFDTTRTTANELTGGDPQTPILRAPAGMPVRIHILEPGGIGDNQQSFELTGHVWQETPYQNDSTKIGYNPKSYYTGLIPGFGPTTSYPIVLSGEGNGTPAGGRFGVPGDYLWRSWTANQFQAGLWGILRVAPAKGPLFPDTVGITSVAQTGNGYSISGFTTVSPQDPRKVASSVTLIIGARSVRAKVTNGLWTYRGSGPMPATFTVRSPLGGIATWGTAPSRVTESDVVTRHGQTGMARTDRRARQPR